MSIISQTPNTLRAGDTAQWLVSVPDYTASAGWTLKYKLINASNQYDIVSAASGDEHQINVAAATTAAYVAGDYQLVAYVTNVATQRFTLEEGAIKIQPNVAAAVAGMDTRTSAQKCLDAMNLALESYGNKAYTQEYEIAGRRIKYASMADFLKARSQITAEVQRELSANAGRNGIPFGPKVLTEYR
jgi:hypothetical protein